MPVEHDRDCPKCGATTTVNKSGFAASGTTPLRVCDNDACNWQVVISGPTIV